MGRTGVFAGWSSVLGTAKCSSGPAARAGPTGLGGGGWPLGLQLIVRPPRDLVLLRLAVTPPALQVE